MKMGGKGKKAAPAKAAEKPEKKAKRKSRGGGDGIVKLKRFFVDHVEKVALGVIAALSAYLILAGFRSEALQESPATVKSAIASAQSTINAATWSAAKLTRYAEPDRFDQQATEDTTQLDVAAYEMPRAYHLPMMERRKKRADPQLLAPVEVEVHSGYGAITLREAATGGGDTRAMLTTDDENSRPIPDALRDAAGNRIRITSTGSKLESRFFVVIHALIPYTQQFKIYEETLSDADAYNPERDRPDYRGMQIERAEVQPDGSLGPWTALDVENKFFGEPELWESSSDEMASSDYLGFKNLVMRMPPIIYRDLSKWAVHSKVPLETYLSGGSGERREGGETNGKEGEGKGGERASEREGAGPRGFLADEQSSQNEAANEGDRGASENRAIPQIRTDVSLIRYFDFEVTPGKTYKYRVRAIVLDPNNPFNSLPKPPNSACEPDVVRRRQVAPDEHTRLTEWSAPSATVMVNSGYQVASGEVTQPKLSTIGTDGRVRIEQRPGEEPLVKIVAMSWKKDGPPFDVPVVVKAGRGAVLDGTVDTEAIDPMRGVVTKVEKYGFSTGAMVADAYGGFPVEREVFSPSYALVMTPDGQLHFQGEAADRQLMRMSEIPAEETLGMGDASRAEGRGESERMRESERQNDSERPERSNGRTPNRRRGAPRGRPGGEAGRAAE